MIFLTDKIFVYYPEKATEILDQFMESRASKPVGGRFDRIVARPGVKDWIRKLANEKLTERGRPDTRWLPLYLRICKLCPPEDEEPYALPNPLPSASLVSIPAESLPSFRGLWERDEVAATNLMIEWFAGWSVMNAVKFRRFYVCYEPKGGEGVPDGNGRFQVVSDPRGWSKRYNHIRVQRPDEMIKEGARKPKPSK